MSKRSFDKKDENLTSTMKLGDQGMSNASRRTATIKLSISTRHVQFVKIPTL
jgi:hypothetical protein